MEESNQTKAKGFIKNIIIVLISNAFSVISGVLVGFVVPKIMGVTDYGYYKTFTLYASYIGLFHFGFIDGIYLYYAGKDYIELDKQRFRLYNKFLFGMEAIITLLFSLFSLIFIGQAYFFVFLLVGLYLFATNIIYYYEYITQITMRFKQLSVRSIIKCLVTTIAIVILYILYKLNGFNTTYLLYASIVVGINYLLALWYVFSYREITFGKALKLKEELPTIKKFFHVGFPLLLANLVAQLIFLVDQQFVNILFTTEEYATYAFAYNMINLITIATNAIATVLFPTLKRTNKETIKNNYSRLNAYLMIFVFICLCAYFPLDLFVNYFLKDYIPSLTIFRIVFPGLVISSSVSVIKYNYYKNFNKINNYFFKSIIILVLAIIADTIVYLIFKNTISISIVSIFVLLIWYLITEFYFIKEYKVKWISNLIYLILGLASFYLCAFLINNIYLSCIIYIISIIAITLILQFSNLKKLKSLFIK